jgi:two-component system response regulator YesN
MLRVLLIDDEPVIREGLKSIIDWKMYGMDICGEAEDGLQGLEQILNLKPDIAIVDVKMPQMDGLEMIEEVKRRGIECVMIVLTAYCDFKFAQKSIELGIHSYILKPIEQEELKEKICKLRESIHSSKTEKHYIDVGISLSREKVLHSIAIGELCEDAITDYNNKYSFGFPWDRYQVALIDIYNCNSKSMLLLLGSIKAEVENYVLKNRYGYIFELNGYVAVLFKSSYINSINRIATELQKILLCKTEKEVVVILGPVVRSFNDISMSCSQALELINKKFIYGRKRIIMFQNMGNDNLSAREAGMDENQIIVDLCTAIEVDNHDTLNNITENILTNFLLCSDNENIIKSRYAHMYMMITNRIISENECIRNEINSKSVIDEIYRKESLQELHGYFKFSIFLISEVIARHRPDNLFDRLLDYINRNYYKDIKLETLAEIFNYNSAYLGKLFKNNTGMFFNTYLDTIRINNAKAMLREGLKVYQVAEKTGYKDIGYFYKKFKKYAGVPPTNFKEKGSN